MVFKHRLTLPQRNVSPQGICVILVTMPRNRTCTCGEGVGVCGRVFRRWGRDRKKEEINFPQIQGTPCHTIRVT